jgi:hypothetical protein
MGEDVFDLDRFIEDCRAAVREDSSQKAAPPAGSASRWQVGPTSPP